MKVIENMKNWLYSLKDMYSQLKHDKKMKKQFPSVIKSETNDRESFFNQNNLKSSDNFTKVYKVIDIPEEYQLKGQQWQIMDKLNENSYAVSRYLRETLKLENNVSMPEYYHIEDPSSGRPFSCRYIAVWTYVPTLVSKKTIYIVNTFIGIAVALLAGISFYFLKFLI